MSTLHSSCLCFFCSYFGYKVPVHICHFPLPACSTTLGTLSLNKQSRSVWLKWCVFCCIGCFLPQKIHHSLAVISAGRAKDILKIWNFEKIFFSSFTSHLTVACKLSSSYCVNHGSIQYPCCLSALHPPCWKITGWNPGRSIIFVGNMKMSFKSGGGGGGRRGRRRVPWANNDSPLLKILMSLGVFCISSGWVLKRL